MFTWKLKGEGHVLALRESSQDDSPRVPGPAKGLLQSREVSGSLEDASAFCLAPASAPSAPHSSPISLHLLYQSSLPLALISILLCTDESIDTGAACPQMSESCHRPRTHHDTKINPIHLPGVAWDLRSAWSRMSSVAGQGTEDCHNHLGPSPTQKHPTTATECMQPGHRNFSFLLWPVRGNNLWLSLDTSDSPESAPHSQGP